MSYHLRYRVPKGLETNNFEQTILGGRPTYLHTGSPKLQGNERSGLYGRVNSNGRLRADHDGTSPGSPRYRVTSDADHGSTLGYLAGDTFA